MKIKQSQIDRTDKELVQLFRLIRQEVRGSASSRDWSISNDQVVSSLASLSQPQPRRNQHKSSRALWRRQYER